MDLGALSISLAVKDIAAARAFYEKSGFEVFGGDASQNWLILKNGDHVIGFSRGCSRKTSSRSTPVGIATRASSIPSRTGAVGTV
jgi:hypothetical protein